MDFNWLKELLAEKRVLVLLGEAGSGKSEIAIALALWLRGETKRNIHLFDLDQTKPMFRSRDVAELLRDNEITFHCNEGKSFDDVAAIVPGVTEALTLTDDYIILDVGGNVHGAHMVGQFSQYLNREDAMVLFLVNPYRTWSRTTSDMFETMETINQAARTAKAVVVSNPNLGSQTSVQDVVVGHHKLKQMMGESIPICFVCALDGLCEDVSVQLKEPIFPVKLRILNSWLNR